MSEDYYSGLKKGKYCKNEPLKIFPLVLIPCLTQEDGFPLVNRGREDQTTLFYIEEFDRPIRHGKFLTLFISLYIRKKVELSLKGHFRKLNMIIQYLLFYQMPKFDLNILEVVSS